MSQTRLYIDTNVLLHYLKSNYQPNFAKLAGELMEKIENGIYDGVVSTFTLAELIKLLRDVMVKFEHNHDPNDWDHQIEKGLDSILTINNINVVQQHGKTNGQPLLFDDIVNEGLRIMKQFSGSIKQVTDKKKHTKKYRHDGMFIIDAYHVTIAKELQCTNIATFDSDFDECRSEIVPLILHKNTSW